MENTSTGIPAVTCFLLCHNRDKFVTPQPNSAEGVLSDCPSILREVHYGTINVKTNGALWGFCYTIHLSSCTCPDCWVAQPYRGAEL